MYYYIISDSYDPDEIVGHQQKFTQEEFTKMCSESPDKISSYDIVKYLVGKYNFVYPSNEANVKFILDN